MKKHFICLAVFIFSIAVVASAQLIASENFNYAAGTIVGQNGGTGWGTPWQTTPFNISNTSIVNPGLSGPNIAGIGNSNHQPGSDFRNFRMLDTSNAAFFPYMDYTGDAGATASTNYLWGSAFGANNTTIWFGMLMRKTVASANIGYGGMHLMYGYNLAFDQYGDKRAHQRFQFGTDNNSPSFFMASRTINGNPNLPAACGATVRSNVQATTTANTLIYRIDFKPGAERVFMWTDPAPGCTAPDTNSALIKMNVCDFRFNAVNIGAGTFSGNVQYDFDELRIGLTYPDVVTCSILPVTFIDFSGTAEEKNNLLQWSTATESNNNYFAVERSADGSNFIQLAVVASAAPDGNSQNVLRYSYTDTKPVASNNYYRLRQVNNNGNVVYSSVIKITRKENTFFINTVAPNPVADKLTLSYYAPQSTVANISVSDVTGRIVLLKKENIISGTQSLPLNISGLSKGKYFLKIITPNCVQSLQFFKQ